MKPISKEEVAGMIEAHETAGHHIDSRLKRVVYGRQTNLFLLTIDDRGEFLSLIWQEIDGLRLLAPGGSRTLKDVAQRMLDETLTVHTKRGPITIKGPLTFQQLASDLGLDPKYHRPDWFRGCVKIDSAFLYSSFGWVTLVTANDSERSQSPSGTYYIHDGVHKTLVLAKRLLKNETEFEPVTALLLNPRP